MNTRRHANATTNARHDLQQPRTRRPMSAFAAVRWIVACPLAWASANGIRSAAESAVAVRADAGQLQSATAEFVLGVCLPAAAFSMLFVWLAGRIAPAGRPKVGLVLWIGVAMASAMELLTLRGPLPIDAIWMAAAQLAGAGIGALGLLTFGREEPVALVYSGVELNEWSATNYSAVPTARLGAAEPPSATAGPSIGERAHTPELA